jgi:hypothetical protein
LQAKTITPYRLDRKQEYKMMDQNRLYLCGFAVALAIFLFFGCTATTKTYSPDDVIHYDEAYDASDKKKIVNTLVDQILSEAAPRLSNYNEQPVLIVYGISNQTSEHINTSGITDDIRDELLSASKFRFINETQRDNIQKELAYQYGGAVDPATRIERGRQAGADYMLTGTLRSIEKEEPRQVRLKKKKLNYYSLNLEMTDLKTGLIEWAGKVEIVRESAKPFIGW